MACKNIICPGATVFLLVFWLAAAPCAKPAGAPPALPGDRHQEGGVMRVVFLGDSLTHRFAWSEALPGYVVLNFGIDGDTTLDVLARLSTVIAVKPDVVFLQIGINDYLGMDAWMGESPPSAGTMAAIVRNHGAIWRKLQKALPRTKLYVCSLLPTAFPFDADGRINAGIREINAQLERSAREAGLPYIPLYSRFADAGGGLAKEFSRDGVHLSPAAYAVWLETIHPFLDSFRLP
ncbi:MAG: GDSL-type esterase/lipase family protein [Desulfovibrio sp.]|jgi:lysophospholipase L1-like esterase|nr:GDSL-type esterase/lipase family protein [Desulfovibrio sp.]